MSGLPDLEELFNDYLAAHWDGQTPLDELQRRWSLVPCPALGGLSPRQYLEGKSPRELAEMLAAYTRSEELGIPELLRQYLAELGPPAREALWELVEESRRAPAATSKEHLVPVVALEVLAEMRDPALLPRLVGLLTQEAAAGRALLVPPLVSALAGLGEVARPALLSALYDAPPAARLPLARALAALPPEEVTRAALLASAAAARPAERAAWAEILPAAAGRAALFLLQSWVHHPALDAPTYRALAAALRQLGEEPPARPDLLEDALASAGADRLLREGQALLAAGDPAAAARLLSRAASLDQESPWPCLALARAWQELKRSREAAEAAREACWRAETAWAENPHQDYALVESVLRAADPYLGDPASRREERWRAYARGALALYGVLRWETLCETLDLAVEVPWRLTPARARQLLAGDATVRSARHWAASRDVEDVPRVLAARPAGLSPKPWNLSALKLAAEEQWDFLRTPAEEEALRHLLDVLHLNGPPLPADQVSLDLRNSADPAEACRRLDPRSSTAAPALLAAVKRLWPHTFRWELLGWTPAELSRPE